MTEIQEKIEKINKERFSNIQNYNIISVSKLFDFISEPFDKEASAKSCELKGKNDPKYKYAGMTAEEIIAQWDATASESIMYGSLLDEYTEQILSKTPDELELWKLNNNYDTDLRLKNNCIGFDQFYADICALGFEYAGREITVYGECGASSQQGDMPFDIEISDDSQKNIVVGRIDCLFYNKNKNSYLIVDWKTTDNIKTSAFRSKRLKGPAMKYEDCDISKYIIQVQTYKNDLIKTYKLATADKIKVLICNLRKEPETTTGKNYKLYVENVPFDSATLDEIVNFSIKKRKLLKKIELSHQQQNNPIL